MKIYINNYGYGEELAIGTVSQEIWDYIQDHYDGDTNAYLDDLCENGKIPEKYMLAESCRDLYDNDDLYHSYGGDLRCSTIEIEDEDGNKIYSISTSDSDRCAESILEDAGIQYDIEHLSIPDNIKYISVFRSSEKGDFLSGNFEINGNFDPKKLKLYCMSSVYGATQIKSFSYDGQPIECEFGATVGKSLDIEIINLTEENP